MSDIFEKGLEHEKQGDYVNAFSAYLQAAEEGCSDAQINIARMYYDGECVEQNYEEALRWYSISAEQGNSEGQWRLGYMYAYGKGVEVDFEEAVKWYHKSAEQGNPGGQWRLGYMYMSGKGVEQNYDEATKWFSIAAEEGDATAQFYLGIMHEEGLGCDTDCEEAETWFRLSAEQGYYAAYTKIGKILLKRAFYLAPYYSDKRFSKKNDPDGKAYAKAYRSFEMAEDEAYKWFVYPAECGDIEAQELLVFAYRYGRYGLKKDLEKAFIYLQNAVEDDPDALFRVYELAEMYLYGEGTPVDYQKAAELFEYIIEKETNRDKDELKNSQWQLGLLYENGNGVPQNLARAIELYEASYKNRSPVGAFYLALQYRSGEYLGVDIDKYLKLLKYAVDKWVAPAMYTLGYDYYDGFCVKRDLKQAKEWFKRANGWGYSCSYAIDMVENELARIENKSLKEINKSNPMRKYAEELNAKNIPINRMYPRVIKDLKKDFGDCWDRLDKSSQKFLSTAVVCYIALYSMGEKVYGNMDFTSCITPMIKSLELEIGKYLYTGYINYLNENNIPISVFKSERIFIKRESSYVFYYKDPNKLSEFTLGSFHLVIGLDKASQMRGKSKEDENRAKASIDKAMLDYLKSIFDKDAFGDLDLDRAITDYIVDLSTEIKSITDSFRNPAAHSTVMSCSKAEACANALIKAKKIICKFVEKIKV